MSTEAETGRAPVMEDWAGWPAFRTRRFRGPEHDPNVSPRTRERVEKAIAELGYRRNTAARSLVTRRSQTIGVLGSDMSHYGPSDTLLGVQQAARDQGDSVSMANLSEVTPAAIKDALEYFMLQSVDGIVVIVPHETMFEALRTISISVPLVAVGFGVDER